MIFEFAFWKIFPHFKKGLFKLYNGHQFCDDFNMLYDCFCAADFLSNPVWVKWWSWVRCSSAAMPSAPSRLRPPRDQRSSWRTWHVEDFPTNRYSSIFFIKIPKICIYYVKILKICNYMHLYQKWSKYAFASAQIQVHNYPKPTNYLTRECDLKQTHILPSILPSAQLRGQPVLWSHGRTQRLLVLGGGPSGRWNCRDQFLWLQRPQHANNENNLVRVQIVTWQKL